MIFPNLAAGFQKQTGNILGFGECDESSEMSFANMDSQTLQSTTLTQNTVLAS